MNICAIDQSFSGTALIIFDFNTEEILHLELIKSSNKDPKTKELFSTERRIKEIIDSILLTLKEYDCSHLFLEGLSFKSVNSRSSRDLGGLFYSLLISLINNNIEYKYFAPTTVKAFAIKGNAKKEEVLASVPEHVVELFERIKAKKTTGLYDLADSYFIGKLGIKTLKEK